MSGYVATIGFFDGVHLGHRHLIADVRREAHERGLQSMVVTFANHPREVTGNGTVPQLLTTPAEKATLLTAAGIDRCEVLTFDKTLAMMSASEFMERILRQQYGVEVLVIGYDNRFGNGRHAGFDDYVAYGKSLGIEVIRSEVFTSGDLQVSSSAIRSLIKSGDMRSANAALGYTYSLSGVIVSGTQTGHTIGFPTANIDPASVGKLIPASGVYAVRVTTADGSQWEGMMNIGHRPTFHGEGMTIEVNIFGLEADLYGQTLQVSVVDRLRAEQCYESSEALRHQLEADRTAAISILSSRQQ